LIRPSTIGGGFARFALHRDFGYMIGLLLLVVIIAAIVGRLGRRQIAYAIALMVLFTLQSIFVGMRASAPEIAALLPLNGFLIIAVAFVSGREAWTAWRARSVKSMTGAGLDPEAGR
jgi:Family of unknown function (DUF6220)